MRNRQCPMFVFLFAALFLSSLLASTTAWGDLSVGDNDSVIITVDEDDDDTGELQVIDSNAGSPVTVINADAATTTVGSAATEVTGTLTVLGATTTNGIDNDGDGITSAGAISGATTLTASSVVSAGSLTTGGTLNVSGLSTLDGGIAVDGIHISDVTSGTNNITGVADLTATNVNSTNVAAGDTSGTAGTVNVTDGAANTIILNGTTGAIGGTSLATTGNADIGGALTVTSTTTLTGALTANGGATINSGATVNGGATIFSGIGVGNHLSVGSAGINATAGDNTLTIDDFANTITLTADNDALSTNERGGLIITPTTISMGTRTGDGDDRGLWISPTETVITGGTGTTSMTLDDGGATFADASTGAPVTVTGVANASSDFDAVNYKQFKNLRDKAYSGIASVAALAAIPTPMPGKNYSIGTGFGNYAGENAVALGGKAHLGNNISVGAGFGYTGDDFTTNVGLGYSW